MTTRRRSGCGRAADKLVCWALGGVLVCTALSLCGCGIEPEPMQICPGRGSVDESLAALRANAQKATAMGANGKCLLTYYVDGKKRKESFTIKLRVNPPRQMYLQGDIAFDARGIVAGSNEREFWLAIKPKDISTYWHGQWSEVRGSEGLIFNPRVMLEALGIADVGEGGENDWSLVNEGPFDILTLRGSSGMVLKKVYVYCCDYVVRKIEYFSEYEQLEMSAELGRYVEVSDGFRVPTAITISRHLAEGKDSARVTLSNPKEVTLTEIQILGLFNPPRGIEKFEHRRELIEGEWIDR